MVTLLPDHDVEGQFEALVKLWLSSDLLPYWNDLNLRHESFDTLGIAADALDSQIWKICQEREMILVTGNRNRQGTDSLEEAIARGNTESSLPVFTISAPDQFTFDPNYARRVAEKILDYVSDLEKIRGVGRLFVP